MTIDELQNKWNEKRMYGQFVREIKDDVAQIKSWAGLKASDLKGIFPYDCRKMLLSVL